MKKLLLFFFLFNFFSIEAARVQITFNQGFNIYVVTDDPLFPSVGSTTNNNEINSIFLAYSVTFCFSTYTENGKPVVFADYFGTDLNGFINDLESDSNVTKVGVCADLPYYSFADLLYIKLVDNTNGNPIGTNANQNISTTNELLNVIFDNYNVSEMDSYLGSIYYQIYFDGDITQLHSELSNLNTVIESVDYVGVAMLSTSEFENSNTTITPNPFSSIFTINSSGIISYYTVSDISGKTIISTVSKSELDSVSSQLNSGIYLLNLQFENGSIGNYKIIKN